MRRAATILVAVLTAGLWSGCSDPSPAKPTDRLWISELPTGPSKTITAFLVTRARGDNYFGAFWQGSMYRGGHDLFEWESAGPGRAKLRFLQDDGLREVRFESCEPSTGFDHCIVLHGDPKGVGRYQSRKRWIVRGRKGATALHSTIRDLATEDDDLARLAGSLLPEDVE